MTITEYTAASLEELISSQAFAEMPVIPISRHRAISHIHNPRLEASDPILFAAYDGQRLIGYLGVVPDWYYTGEKPNKMGWMSCIWVAPDTAGKGIAKELVIHALNAWSDRLMVTEITPEARRLYMWLGDFTVLTELRGLRCFLRFELHQVLPPKKKLFSKTKGILKIADAILNPINDIRIRIQLSKRGEKAITEQMSGPDQEAIDFISRHRNKNELNKRAAAELNWILSYPWILPKKQDDGLSGRYFFSAVDTRFEFRLVKVRDTAGKLVAVLLISIRNKHLKVPYAYIDKSGIDIVTDALLGIMRKEGISTFTSFNPLICEQLKKTRLPFLFIKETRREILSTKKIIATMPEDFVPFLQDGDADAVFI